MFSPRFIKFSFLSALVVSVLGSFLLIDNFNVEPSTGLFAFFIIVLVANLVMLKISNSDISFNILSVASILSYIFICAGFIINTKNHFINVILLLGLIIFLNLNLNSNKFGEDFFSKLLFVIQYYILSKTERFVMFFVDAFKFRKEQKNVTNEETKQKLKRITIVSLIFIIIGCPLFAIVLTLLASSNDFFAEWLSSTFSLNVDLEIWIGRLIFIMFVLPYFLSEFIFARVIVNYKENIEKFSINLGEELSKSVAMALISITALLNFFYLIFVIAELKYDFGSLRELVEIKNIESFSTLAVSRFWELIVITLINVAIIYFGRKHLRNIQTAAFNIFIKLNVVILLLNSIFLIFSAYQRLNLYISTYGFSHKRLEALTLLPVLLMIALLIFGSVFVRNSKSLNSIAVGLTILYFSFMIAIPSTYVINSINYQWYKEDKIEVYDPMYSIPVQYKIFAGYSQDPMEHPIYIETNDIRDMDGLPFASQILNDESINLSKNERERLQQAINNFLLFNMSDWREYNQSREWIKTQID